MNFLKEIADMVLENSDDFFTSGLQNAMNSYYSARHAFAVVSVIAGLVCIAALGIKVFFF